jgi:hypothetical protein
MKSVLPDIVKARQLQSNPIPAVRNTSPLGFEGRMTFRSLALLMLLTLALFAQADGPGTPTPGRVKFSAAELPVDASLKELQDQTGNIVQDLRTKAGGNKQLVQTRSGDFWPTLDDWCQQTGSSFNAYRLENAIALVDGPPRKSSAVHYSGIFRFAIKSLETSRDDETGTHLCRVTLDTAWEPRFLAILANLEKAEVRVGKQTIKLDSDGSFSVAGKCATQGIRATFSAPDRRAAKLDALEGTMRVVGVPKMLDIGFAKLKDRSAPRNETQDGVKVSVTAVEARKGRWTVELETIHPEGAILPLQSFEEPALLALTRVWLTWGTDPRTGKPFELEARETDPQSKTKTQYHFTPNALTPAPPIGAEVTLRYRTPARVIAVRAAFAFRDLPLP